MKNLIWILMFLVGGLNAQVTQKPMYPADRTNACITGICASGISYPLFYSAFGGNNGKNSHMLATFSSAGVSVLASMLTFTYGPSNNQVNARQNVTASLCSSAVTITLIRIGIGNSK